MYDLHRLRLLRELKHRGTMAAVAAALSYAPSTVSEQLAQLEAEVGVPLLEPAGRRVRLTGPAEILVAHTEAILARLERAEAEVAGSSAELTGTLRVAAFQTAALALLPAALAWLRARHPGLRVHLRELEPEQALPALLARDFDLAVGEEYPGLPDARPAGLAREDLLDDPIHLATPPAHRGGALRDLAGQVWAMEPEGTAARQWATARCRAAGFEPDVRFETADLLLHVRLVEQGLAAAFLPDLVWNGRPPTVPLRPLPGGEGVRRLFTVVRRGRSGHPAVRACREALRQAGRASPAR
ncbi:LysR family transcriptional regulator [Nonomuraea sp. NPDC050310]|uniref:LysR family transcriptional regulator n=1 Tax=unclassified Nonomuraea TaxID=2593643 RepID=UPI0033CD2DF1